MKVFDARIMTENHFVRSFSHKNSSEYINKSYYHDIC